MSRAWGTHKMNSFSLCFPFKNTSIRVPSQKTPWRQECCLRVDGEPVVPRQLEIARVCDGVWGGGQGCEGKFGGAHWQGGFQPGKDNSIPFGVGFCVFLDGREP